MPTLNYENVGALVEYDYLQGTISAVYPEDDTADVSGVCGTLSRVPIFYHCKPDSAARDNGSLTGAAGGFKVNDLVVVLKSTNPASSSLYNLNKIELKGSSSTATGPKYFVVGHYDGVKRCTLGNIVFIIVNADNVIEFYRYDNSKTDDPVLWKTLDINPIVNDGVPEYTNSQTRAATQDISIMYGEGDINSLIIRAWVSDWRGNSVASNNSSWTVFNSFFPVKIPIDFFTDDKTEAGLVNHFSARYPNGDIMSQSGLIAFIADPNGTFQGYRAEPIDQYAGYFMNHVLPLNTGTFSSDYNHFYPAIGLYGDNLIVAYWQEHGVSGSYSWSDASLLVYNTVFWQGEEPVSTLSLMNLTDENGIPKIKNIAQILGYDDRIFVFYCTRYPYWIYPLDITVEVYDMSLNTVKSRQSIVGVSGTVLSRVTIINDGINGFLCFRTITDGPVYLVDPDTLELVKTIDLSASKNILGFQTFLGVSAPKTNYMLDQINTYRFTQSPYTEYIQSLVDYPMPVSYLGYSYRLEQCAQLHVNWLISVGRERHEGLNGTDLVHERGVDFGYRNLATGENLALIDTTVFTSEKAQIDEVLRLWKESSGHNLNLVNRGLNCMGYASEIYPSIVHEIIIGTGMYNPVTHEYSTGETTITLDPSKYGKMKLFVYNVAEG